ncbi:MAG: DUF4369 domain-containing protein [Bacteroidales bacterium]|nr:DUF4369 domain-containing protein [Bacteroidales bacterium]
MMRKWIHIIGIVALASLAWGCSSGTFRVDGEVKGLGTQTLKAIYWADDALRVIPATAIDGKFSFEGKASEPALMEIVASNRRVLARVMVENGDAITLSLDNSNPYAISASGNDLTERWAEWIRNNAGALGAGDPRKCNEAIAKYVESHNDDVLSTLLLVTTYNAQADPEGAERLIAQVSEKARPGSLAQGWAELVAFAAQDSLAGAKIPSLRVYNGGDSLLTIEWGKKSRTLLAFTTDGTGRADSVVETLRKLHKDGRRVVDVSVETDSAEWRFCVEGDSAKWTQVWAPGGLSSPTIQDLRIPRLPWFIVVDSLGTPLYRGPSMTAAKKQL